MTKREFYVAIANGEMNDEVKAMAEKLREVMDTVNSKRAAKVQEKASAERGYAQHIIDNIHTIYGEALREPKPLADEIKALSARKERIQNYLTATAKDDTVSEEERARLNFSVKAHERKIAELKKQD